MKALEMAKMLRETGWETDCIGLSRELAASQNKDRNPPVFTFSLFSESTGAGLVLKHGRSPHRAQLQVQ